MVSLKSKIKFNKVRNKGEKIKTKFKKDKSEKPVKEKKPKNKRKIIYYILSFITFLAILCVLAVIGFAIYIVKSAPEFTEDKLYNKESTIIYKGDGSILTILGMSVGTDSSGDSIVETRVKLEYEDLPQVLVDAVVATEDSRFFQHNGVDLARFVKASIGQVLGNSDAGGASTLTMQVSKNALTDTTSEGIKGIIRKFTDVYLSVFKIEKKFTKQDILTMYVNSGFLGQDAFGVEQASQTYFGKSARDLTLVEAAMIAGLFQAPSAYDPFTYPEEAKARRNQVLNLMYRHGYITKDECEIAKDMPIEDMLVKTTKSTSYTQGYVNMVIDEVQDTFGVDPYSVPLKIYTTFDQAKQNVINGIYDGSLGYTFKDDAVQLGVAVVDNNTGAVLAIGAGRDSANAARTYNRATMIRRHPGSTIKPLLDYGPAIEYLNWSEYTPIFDEADVKYSSGGIMHNFDFSHDGLISLKYALSESKNTCALQTFQATTNEQKWKFIQSLGITPGNSDGVIFESSSIGAFEGTNPVELAGAYAAIASGGYYTKPYSVTSIEFVDTGEKKENKITRTRVMKDTTAYMLTDVLFNVTTSIAQVPGNQIATKTGTSSYESDTLNMYGLPSSTIQDSWIATFNPDFTITFWYGYDELNQDMVNNGYYNIHQPTNIQRNTIQSILTKNILNTGSKFTIPKGLKSVTVELETFPAKLPSPYTPGDSLGTYYFISGTEPTEVSTRFAKLEDPKNVSIENDISATVSWEKPKTPDFYDPTYLASYFNKYYKQWAQKYYDIRINYNENVLGPIGFDIYLKSGSNLTYVGHTTEDSYTIDNIAGYDSVVVKTAHSIFKTNQSDGVTVLLTGEASDFEIVLEAIDTKSGYLVNPVFAIGDKIPDLGIDTIKFIVNNEDVTSSIKNNFSYTIEDCTNSCKTVEEIDNTKQGFYKITYEIVYMGTPFTRTREVQIV